MFSSHNISWPQFSSIHSFSLQPTFPFRKQQDSQGYKPNTTYAKTFRFRDCLLGLYEPQWALLRRFCWPCFPGVLDLSDSSKSVSFNSTGFPSSKWGTQWRCLIWELSLCLIFGCVSLNLLPSGARGSLFDDDLTRHWPKIKENVVRNHLIDYFFFLSFCLS